MDRRQVTASERRGIIALAAISLLLTGGGMALSRCSRREVTQPQAERVWAPADNAGADTLPARQDAKSKVDKSRVKGNDGKRKGNKQKEQSYGNRAPLDEIPGD